MTKLLKIHFAFIISLITFYSNAQTTPDSNWVEIKGTITHALDSIPLKKATILDLNSIDGAITNDKGQFSLNTKVNDTIMISYIGFQSVKIKVTNDLSKANELNISLYPKAEQLSPVIIHKLVGVLEIDMKTVPRDRFNRVHIKGLPQTYEIQKSSARNPLSLAGAVTNPVDYVYNLFGKKPKKLRKLKALKAKDNTREILAQRFDREIILDYLEIDLNKLTEILSECNYSNYFIKSATDLQLIEAVIECYENDNAVKKGATINTSKPFIVK